MHRAVCQANQALAGASHNAVIQSGSANETDDEQINFIFINELNNGFYLMTGYNVGRDGELVFVRYFLSLCHDGLKMACYFGLFFLHLTDALRKTG